VVVVVMGFGGGVWTIWCGGADWERKRKKIELFSLTKIPLFSILTYYNISVK
jgi:hypothetical protein